MRNPAMWGATPAMILSWAATACASTFVYTDRTAWENAVGGQFLAEDFADDQLNAGVTFVSSESGHINPAEEAYQDVLASASQNEPMTIWSFVPKITAYGGNWTLGGPGGAGNNLLVYVGDSSVYVGAIPNSYSGGFWGFASDAAFTSVKLIGGGGTHQQHYSLDNMVYRTAPQPALPGDLDLDNDVDGYDFLLWQGGAATNPPRAADLAVWEAHYGEVVALTAVATAVPEPATWISWLLAMTVLPRLRRSTRLGMAM